MKIIFTIENIEVIGGRFYHIYTSTIGYVKFYAGENGKGWYSESNIPQYSDGSIPTKLIEKYNELVLNEEDTTEIEIEVNNG